MSDIKIASVLALSIILLSINVIQAESILWDLQIDVSVSNDPVHDGDPAVIIGSVTDHAGAPLENIIVKIRTESETITTLTDSNGSFEEMFFPNRIVGTHVINIKAISEDGKIGLADTTFKVVGGDNISSQTENLLSTSVALKYLNSIPEDFENNSCKQKTRTYQRTFVENPKEKQQEILEMYKKEHGIVPCCNLKSN